MNSKNYQIYSNKITKDKEKEKRSNLYMKKVEYDRVVKEETEMPKISREEFIKGYIKEVLDNYNNMSIEDRLKVNEILEKFYNDNREYCYSHDYTFKHINLILENMLKIKEFSNLYSSLDEKERCEMDEQILLACTTSSPFDYSYERNLINNMLSLEYEGKTNEPTFKLDEELLNN